MRRLLGLVLVTATAACGGASDTTDDGPVASAAAPLAVAVAYGKTLTIPGVVSFPIESFATSSVTTNPGSPLVVRASPSATVTAASGPWTTAVWRDVAEQTLVPTVVIVVSSYFSSETYTLSNVRFERLLWGTPDELALTYQSMTVARAYRSSPA